MPQTRVLAIGLDGIEFSVAERLMEQGRLPAMQRLSAEAAKVKLDHGKAKRTGLAWEHVATGRSPEAAGRWGAVEFDPQTYRVVQTPTALKPFAGELDASTLVFDAPYFDLDTAPDVRGLVGWGAHDAGVELTARPAGLADEIEARFGAYRATRWIYSFTWPSAERTREAASALASAVDQRAEVAEWLFAERFPDWEFGFLVVSEYHSAIEPFWHGLDADHPLHGLASGEEAREGIEGVYEAADRLVGRLSERFPDARLVLFNLHGMGPNQSDVASMALLPELLYRREFGRPRLREARWPTTPAGVPLLAEDKGWEAEISRLLQPRLTLPWNTRSRIARASERLLRRRKARELSMHWMPAAQYRRFWPRMEAFAFPSFYDGRVRINLEGRERQGRVPRQRYDEICGEIEQLLGECRDPITGEPVMAAVERAAGPDKLEGTGADLTILWNGSPLGFVHPRLGTIGPLPYRRTGGHTGGHGLAWFAGPGIAPGEHELRSAFDVVPTIVDLLGEPVPEWMSGRSLAADIVAPIPEPVAAAAE